MSCPSRGTWIEIQAAQWWNKQRNCRAPRGARGLKSLVRLPLVSLASSCPSRGTWIEIPDARLQRSEYLGRAPRGARGLKSGRVMYLIKIMCRAPRGARGLKLAHS